ncbi:ATP-binding protein [Leifsonia shinshuensis]|uniref:AAA family ATPase n=1 Tax=Leifsonia shinshuensis TaxID=150026 RepID=UPI001F50AE46|nr:ATP-binding protein [Leifsonia shinshuensis]MCI0158552.1 ATP-binding protein [Leifsonia shinshuensis]
MTDKAAPLDRQFGDVRVPVLVVTAGLPGSGKSTIAEIVAGRLGATAISVDPIEAAILKAGIDADQPTGLAAYLVAERMAEQVLVSGHSVIVDAVNAVEPARLQWRDLAERCGVKLRVIETVCADEALHNERLANRTGLTAGYAVEQSIEDYAEWKGAAATLPRVTLDTSRPLGENVDAALAFLEH